jgi:hypothetical protein
MRIARLKTFQAIKVGAESTYVDVETHSLKDKNLSVELKDGLIHIEWDGGHIITSISNMCWMVPMETKTDEAKPKQRRSPKNTSGSKQKGKGKAKVGGA